MQLSHCRSCYIVLIIVVVLSISRSHERTAEELELVFEELVHLSALSHLSTSIKRELASIIVFEAHAAAGTVCKYSEWWWYMDTLIVCAGSSHRLSGLRQRAAAGDDDVLLCNVDFSDHSSYSFASYYYYYLFHKVYYDYIIIDRIRISFIIQECSTLPYLLLTHLPLFILLPFILLLTRILHSLGTQYSTRSGTGLDGGWFIKLLYFVYSRVISPRCAQMIRTLL